MRKTVLNIGHRENGNTEKFVFIYMYGIIDINVCFFVLFWSLTIRSALIFSEKDDQKEPFW